MRLVYSVFHDTLRAPFYRLETTPAWGKELAVLGSIVQFIRHDTFTGALLLLFGSSVIDYIIGVKVAKIEGSYMPIVAHRGMMEKITGLILVLILRAFEHFLELQDVLNTRGILSSGVALSLLAVEIQSIAHHREILGGRPIPILSTILERLQAAIDLFTSKKEK